MAKIKKADESVRDTRRDRAQFDRIITMTAKEVEANEELLSQNKDKIGTEWYRDISIYRIYDQIYYIAVAMYSRGNSLESIRECFKKVWEECKEDEWFIGTGSYERVAFAYCLGFDTSKALALLQDIHSKRKRDKKDESHEFIPFFIASQGKISELGEYILEKWIFEDLEKFILEERNIEYFHSFLKKWYRRHASCSWYGKWNSEYYIGTWNFEAAAVVKILGLNKDEFKEDRYFPYDLA